MELAKSNIENKIYLVRGVQVMLDSDLAELYNTETKFINRAVKRNASRFPTEFMFQLTEQEWQNLRFQSGTSSEGHGGRRYYPKAFTEQGIAMLSAVLHTEIAVNVSIELIENRGSQDRFIVIDNSRLYHFGASLKDLGKKCFAFSQMDNLLPELSQKLLKL